MNYRVFFGTVAAFIFNSFFSWFPSRRLRKAYLRLWLGGFGHGVGVQTGCRILQGRKVFVGERVVINFGCLLDGRHYKIEIGDDVSIGPEATILTLGHSVNSPDFALEGGDVFVCRHAWVGYRAIILPGVTIGEGAVVAAQALVTKDVEPYSIVAGSPAVVIGKRNPNLEYELSYDPWLT